MIRTSTYEISENLAVRRKKGFMWLENQCDHNLRIVKQILSSFPVEALFADFSSPGWERLGEGTPIIPLEAAPMVWEIGQTCACCWEW